MYRRESRPPDEVEEFVGFYRAGGQGEPGDQVDIADPAPAFGKPPEQLFAAAAQGEDPQQQQRATRFRVLPRGAVESNVGDQFVEGKADQTGEDQAPVQEYQGDGLQQPEQ